jgi:hypothetical protein
MRLGVVRSRPLGFSVLRVRSLGSLRSGPPRWFQRWRWVVAAWYPFRMALARLACRLVRLGARQVVRGRGVRFAWRWGLVCRSCCIVLGLWSWRRHPWPVALPPLRVLLGGGFHLRSWQFSSHFFRVGLG